MQLVICRSIRNTEVGNIKMLVTGAGAPGTKGTVFSIEKLGDIVGTDVRAGCNHIIPNTHVVSKPSERFMTNIKELVVSEGVDIILPQVTKELPYLARLKNELGIPVLVNDSDKINTLNNKYNLLNAARKFGCSGEFYLATDYEDFLEKSNNFSGDFVAKVPDSNGSRGVRVITKRPRISFYDKPFNLELSFESLSKVMKEDFPNSGLLLTEYLPNEEYSVDVLAKGGKCILCVPRTREKIVSGITFEGELVKNEEVIAYTKKIVQRLKLDHMCGFQFKCDNNGNPILIESNPRIQGSMVHSTLGNANVIKGAVELALKGETEENQKNIIWGTRMHRFWGFTV